MTQAWDKTLRARGYRVTPQRQLVLAAVTKLEHATPEEIWADVQQTASGVNISTIYRALELLEQLGLVTHTHLGHGAPSYSVHEHQHVHLVCHACGRVIEVPATVTLVAVLIGGAILGIVGALVAIPVAAAVRLLLIESVFPRLDRR